MKIKFVIFLVFAILAVLIGFQFLSQNETNNDTNFSNNSEKIKLNLKSLFNIYGFEEKYEFKNGEKIWNNVFFELNSENNELYEKLKHSSNENTVVIFPLFTAAAYSEPGFYTYYRGDCTEECLTIKLQKEYPSRFISSGNGFQVLKLLEYYIISDIDVDQNPDILKKYDTVILLHNEYVTKKEFDAITNHPNVIYLYPNALYAEITINYEQNSITLLRGHNYPESKIRNGFDWKFDNSILEYDIDCQKMGFDKIDNGWMLNCYPERAIHQSKVLLEMIRNF
jgi:hypothetical protein